MSLLPLINQHALNLAQTGNWAGVASTLNAITTTVHVGIVSGRDSLAAIFALGEDANQVIAAMRAVPMASVLLDTLISRGVDWSDPMTEQIMSDMVVSGVIKQSVVSALRALSERSIGLFATPVTAGQCQAEWQAEERREQGGRLQVIFDSVKNQIGTSEQHLAIAALEALVAQLKQPVEPQPEPQPE